MSEHLFTPGPTPIPQAILDVLARPILHHRSVEAQGVFRRIQPGLQQVFGTSELVLVLSCSGTGAIEAAMCSLGRPGEKALVLNNGKFAQRWVDMLQIFGYEVVDIRVPWGMAAEVQHLHAALESHPNIQQVWMVHSETSTGTFSDIKSLAEVVHQKSDALVCVDSISSLCAHELHMDAWGLDVVVSGSQKGFMLPPGLAMLSLSPRAFAKSEEATIPCYYFDLRKARASAMQDTTPWTPAISLICALETSLEILLAEGMEHLWARHEANASMLRSRATAAGYRLYSSSPSNSVSALYIPESRPTLAKDLLSQYSIRVAGGQDHLKGKIIRVGHLGAYTTADMERISTALEELMP